MMVIPSAPLDGETVDASLPALGRQMRRHRSGRAARNLDTIQRIVRSSFSIWRRLRSKVADRRKGMANHFRNRFAVGTLFRTFPVALGLQTFLPCRPETPPEGLPWPLCRFPKKTGLHGIHHYRAVWPSFRYKPVLPCKPETLPEGLPWPF